MSINSVWEQLEGNLIETKQVSVFYNRGGFRIVLKVSCQVLVSTLHAILAVLEWTPGTFSPWSPLEALQESCEHRFSFGLSSVHRCFQLLVAPLVSLELPAHIVHNHFLFDFSELLNFVATMNIIICAFWVTNKNCGHHN